MTNLLEENFLKIEISNIKERDFMPIVIYKLALLRVRKSILNYIESVSEVDLIIDNHEIEFYCMFRITIEIANKSIYSLAIYARDEEQIQVNQDFIVRSVFWDKDKDIKLLSGSESDRIKARESGFSMNIPALELMTLYSTCKKRDCKKLHKIYELVNFLGEEQCKNTVDCKYFVSDGKTKKIIESTLDRKVANKIIKRSKQLVENILAREKTDIDNKQLRYILDFPLENNLVGIS